MNLPQGIDSKYRFILVAAKRARQLQAGARPLIQTSSKRATRIAMMELEAGVLPFEGSRTKPFPEEVEKEKE